MNITENFTLEELIQSKTATKLGIKNNPSPEVEKALCILALKVLQPIRNALGQSITVTSGYRSEALNKAVGGAKTSQHLKGEASDITLGSKKDNKRLFEVAKKLVEDKKITVGQLIDEKDYTWIHVSTPNTKHINEILHLK